MALLEQHRADQSNDGGGLVNLNNRSEKSGQIDGRKSKAIWVPDATLPTEPPAQTVGLTASVTWLGGLHRHYLRMRIIGRHSRNHASGVVEINL